jgi:hypothetical protein
VIARRSTCVASSARDAFGLAAEDQYTAARLPTFQNLSLDKLRNDRRDKNLNIPPKPGCYEAGTITVGGSGGVAAGCSEVGCSKACCGAGKGAVEGG